MIDQLLNRIDFSEWRWLVPWLFALSVIVFIGSIVVGWVVLLRLPEDYLTRDRLADVNRSDRPLGQLVKKVVKNLVGVAFVVLGIVMLLTPGQGILSIFVGLTLMDFPGKRKLVLKILANPRVLKAINKLRKLANQPPLLTSKSSPSNVP